jgi:HEPN domain-containing protein
VLNTEKQIEYWINTAKTDLDTAELLIRESRNIHGLFFCHLAIEKALKAHVVKDTGQIPPKTQTWFICWILSILRLKIVMRISLVF